MTLGFMRIGYVSTQQERESDGRSRSGKREATLAWRLAHPFLSDAGADPESDGRKLSVGGHYGHYRPCSSSLVRPQAGPAVSWAGALAPILRRGPKREPVVRQQVRKTPYLADSMVR